MSHTLTIEPLGETVEVAEGQTMLDACLRAGIYLPHACGHGLCGSCKVDVLEGDVDHGAASSFALMDFEREGGKTLACAASLLGDVTIEADVEPDPDARRIPVRDFKAQVAAVEDLTRDVKLIRLALDGSPIDFQAGQFISLNIPGVEGSRAFSLASPPQQASAGRTAGPARRRRQGHDIPAQAAEARRPAYASAAPMAGSSCASRAAGRSCFWPAAPAFRARAR